MYWIDLFVSLFIYPKRKTTAISTVCATVKLAPPLTYKELIYR